MTGGEGFLPEGICRDVEIVIDDGRIIRCSAKSSSLPTGSSQKAFPESRILPGFIDLHLHGLLGKEACGSELGEVIRLLPRHGVTAFLASSVTMPLARLVKQLEAARAILDDQPAGAHCLGLHIEGNFFSPRRSGMARAEWCQPLTRQVFEMLQKAAGGWIRMITFAPEEGEAMAVIPWLLDQGVIPAIGHSDASYEQAMKAFRLGIVHATHTFNAMAPFHHRAPGVVGAVLASPQVTAELIADGHHIHPGTMQMLLQVKGAQMVCLVSDAAPLAGMAEGTYAWEGYTIHINGGTCRLADGTLAGAHSLLDEDLRTLLSLVPGLAATEVVRCSSEVPARCLGLGKKKGQLQSGSDADLVVLDRNWQVECTLAGGEIVWERNKTQAR